MRVRQLGDPILRTVSQPIEVEEIFSHKIQQTIAEMKSILNGLKAISDENGNAISAPQVGHTVRMILLRLSGEFVLMINPVFSQVSQEMFAFEEECFSFYHLRGIVERHHKITVDYLDENAVSQSLKLAGDDAALAQHEVDHLDGVLFIDKISDIKHLSSIDHVFKQTPQKLDQVKQLMGYMVA